MSAAIVERLVTRLTGGLVVAAVAAMVAVIWVSVFTRYVLDDPIAWGEQVAKYLMIWASFLGASLGLREGAHVAVNILVERLPENWGKRCAAAAFACTTAFVVLMLVVGTQFAWRVRMHSDPLVGEMSMSVAYAAIPAGFLLMLVQLCFMARRGTGRLLASDDASLS